MLVLANAIHYRPCCAANCIVWNIYEKWSYNITWYIHNKWSCTKTVTIVQPSDIIRWFARYAQSNILKHMLQWKHEGWFSLLIRILIGVNQGGVASLHWRHNWRNSVSNYQPHDCLLNRLLRRRSKKTSKPRSLALCREFTGDRWIPRTNGQ